MKKLLLSLVTLCMAGMPETGLLAQNQDIQWGIQNRSRGNRGSVTGQKITTDKEGNLYTFGIYNDTLYPGGSNTAFIKALQTDNAAGQYEFFLTKTDADSNLVWVKKFAKHTFKLNHAYNPPSVGSIVADDSANIYITGSFPGTIDADPGPGTQLLVAPDSTLVIAKDAFVIKMNTAGDLGWVKHFTKNVTPLFGSYNRATDIRMFGLELDNNGKLYASGVLFECQAGDSVYFDAANTGITKTFTNAIAKNIPFWIKMDPATGSFDDVHILPNGSNGGVMTFALKPDHYGNLYASGHFTDTVDFNFQTAPSYPLTAATPGSLWYNSYIAKYDTAGKVRWAYSMPATRSYANDFVTDHAGNVIVNGGFLDSVKIKGANGTPFSFNYAETAYIAKYDSTGNVLWADRVNLGIAEDKKVIANGMTIDAFDNIYITGTVNGRFNLTPLTFQTYDHAFIQKRNPAGTQAWLMRFGTIPFLAQQSVTGLDVHVDESNNLYTSGTLRRNSFDLSPLGTAPYTLLPGTKEHNYLAKYICTDTASSYHQVTACNEYSYNGVRYTETGIYKKKFWSAGGCDSMVILDLTINNIARPFITVNNFELGVTSAYDTYQWLFNGAILNGATSSTYTAASNGSYRLIAGLANGCKDTSEVYTVSNVTSVNERETAAGKIRVYPNPSSDRITVSGAQALMLSLYSIDGKCILPSAKNNEISVKGLVEGVYLLYVRDAEGNLIKVEKVVKQK